MSTFVDLATHFITDHLATVTLNLITSSLAVSQKSKH